MARRVRKPCDQPHIPIRILKGRGESWSEEGFGGLPAQLASQDLKREALYELGKVADDAHRVAHQKTLDRRQTVDGSEA